LEALRKKGFIESQKGKARSLCIRLIDGVIGLTVPMLGSIPAGISDEREQEPDSCAAVDASSIGFKPTRNTFALRVKGDSMIGRFICDGDIVVLEHGPEPRDGDIVAALIDRKTTLKTFVQKGGKRYLKAENPKYPNLIPSEELVIQGVYKGLIRKA
jgi:repressor LexA